MPSRGGDAGLFGDIGERAVAVVGVVSQASGYAIGSGIGRWASWNVRRVKRSGSAGVEVATTAATRGSAAPARIAPIPPIE
jgi:hypothetical protein